ncbi:MAG: hypothetical protein MJ115_05285 [Clostridia bacterium]|nr:hypothetical protein [Clostridia bacterium]
MLWCITAFFIAFGLAESCYTVLDGEAVANVFRYKAGDLMFFTSMFGEVLMILFMILFGDKDRK